MSDDEKAGRMEFEESKSVGNHGRLTLVVPNTSKVLRFLLPLVSDGLHREQQECVCILISSSHSCLDWRGWNRRCRSSVEMENW